MNSKMEKAAPTTNAPAIKPPARTVSHNGPLVTGRRLATRTGMANRAACPANITASHTQYGQETKAANGSLHFIFGANAARQPGTVSAASVNTYKPATTNAHRFINFGP